MAKSELRNVYSRLGQFEAFKKLIKQRARQSIRVASKDNTKSSKKLKFQLNRILGDKGNIGRTWEKSAGING